MIKIYNKDQLIKAIKQRKKVIPKYWMYKYIQDRLDDERYVQNCLYLDKVFGINTIEKNA